MYAQTQRYARRRDRARLPRLRRRQPLLRGARRLHPPPRPEARGRAACSGARSTAASTTSSAGASATRSSTRRSTRSPRPARCTTTSAATPTASSRYEFLREREPIPAEYRDRDAAHRQARRVRPRGDLAVPDARHPLRGAARHDVVAITQTFTAFNRWLDDDWGFAYQDRIFAAPYITLSDLDWAIRELEWALDHGRAHDRDAPGRAAHRRRPGPGERSAQRPVLGARARGRHHRGRARGRQRLLEQRLRARRVRGRVQRQRRLGART